MAAVHPEGAPQQCQATSVSACAGALPRRCQAVQQMCRVGLTT